MIIQPPHLKKGDRIAIVCPAKKLPGSIDYAIHILRSWGLEVVIGESVYADFNQFAGTDTLRASDLQQFLDDDSVRAIIAGRGGYGCIRIVDELDFTRFKANPKWMAGFSDITVLLSHIFSEHQVQCLHAQMPYTFEDASPASLESLRKALFGETQEYVYESEFDHRSGTCSGVLIGGNLTLLNALQGSVSEMDFKDKILFLEDVGEQEYSIDRMMRMLKRAGKLKDLKGLIAGAFNEISPEKIPFGQSANEVIQEVVAEYPYPVCFDFPSGHINNNMTMILGAEVALDIQKNKVTFKYL